MSRYKWYSVFVRNDSTNTFEKAAEVKSAGLLNLLLPRLEEIYKEVRITKGRVSTMPQ